MNAEHLVELLHDIFLAYPDIDSLNLKNHALNEYNYQAISDFIKYSSKLVSLDISGNFLPAQVVISLQNQVNQINADRQGMPPLYLISDYSVWASYNPLSQYSYIRWALSPKQWQNERDTARLFSDMTYALEENPESISEFMEAFSPDFQYKNVLGWTPILGSIKTYNPNLACLLLDKLGIEVYTNLLINACNGSSVQYLELEKSIGAFIASVYLYHAKNPTYALKLLNAVMPQECGERFHTLGRIAVFEMNYESALEYFLSGAEKGIAGCFSMLAQMMKNQILPESLPYDRVKFKYYLQQAADLGYTPEKIEYGLCLEDENKFSEAAIYYNKADQDLIASPAIALYISPTLQLTLRKRIDFSIKIVGLNDALLNTRTELVRTRFSKAFPGFQAFNSQKFLESLQNTHENIAMHKLTQAYHKILLFQYIQDEKLIDNIKDFLCTNMRNATQINHGLLSMNPEEYGQALVDQVQVYLENHLQVAPPMKSGVNSTALL